MNIPVLRNVTPCTLACGTFSKLAVFVFRVSTHLPRWRSQVPLKCSSSSTKLHLRDAPKEHDLPTYIEYLNLNFFCVISSALR